MWLSLLASLARHFSQTGNLVSAEPTTCCVCAFIYYTKPSDNYGGSRTIYFPWNSVEVIFEFDVGSLWVVSYGRRKASTQTHRHTHTHYTHTHHTHHTHAHTHTDTHTHTYITHAHTHAHTHTHYTHTPTHARTHTYPPPSHTHTHTHTYHTHTYTHTHTLHTHIHTHAHITHTHVCTRTRRIPMPASDLVTALLIVLLFLPLVVVCSHVCRFLFVRKKSAKSKRD